MDSVQLKEFENRDIDRAQQNRITAINMAMSSDVHKINNNAENVIAEARKFLQFIEGK